MRFTNDVSFFPTVKFIPRSIDFKPSISRFDPLDKVVRLGIGLHELFAAIRSTAGYIYELVYYFEKGRRDAYKPHNGIEITFPPLPKESQGRTIRCNKVYTGSCNFDGSNTAKSAPYSTPYRCKPCTRKL